MSTHRRTALSASVATLVLVTAVVTGLGGAQSRVRGFEVAAAAATTSGPVIDTVAGSVCSPRDDATKVGLDPTAVAPDGRGGFYVADHSHNVVCRVTSDGRIAAFAGNGSAGFDGDGGPATDARLYEPTGVAADGQGNVYIADRANHRIRMVDAEGTITTVAGTGRPGFTGDGGPASDARLNFPAGVTPTATGEIYIADSRNHAVRRVTRDGTISTVAGTGRAGFSGDWGPASAAQLRFPTGVASMWGWLLVADAGNNRVRAVAPNGTIHTFAGIGHAGHGGDGGPAAAARLRFPMGVAVDGHTGAVHIADSGNNRIRTVRSGIITTTLGGDERGFSGDGGRATAAQIDFPIGVAALRGRVWVADRGNDRVRLVDAGVVTTVAGNGTAGSSGDGGLATEAQLFQPVAVAETPDGQLLVADGHGNMVRRVDEDGTIHVVAGVPGETAMGRPPLADVGDGGPATEAVLGFVTGLAVHDDGTIYVADWAHRIRRITPDGTIVTVAGTGEAGYGGDGGPGAEARLHAPSGLAVGADGDLYVSDTANNRIRVLEAIAGRVEPVSTIATVAGTGVPGATGDGAAATAARLHWPIDVEISDSGGVYVADHRNHRIRLIRPDGTISTVAGTGQLGYTPEGSAALAAAFNHPASLALTPDGDLLVSDKGNCIVRRITAVGSPRSTVRTIAGWTPIKGVTPVCGFAGDGGSPLAGGTRFFNPLGLHVSDDGTVHVADSLNHRVRSIRYP